MAWRDRLRRRAAADRSGVSGDGSGGGPSGAGPDHGVPDGPSPSAPGAAPASSLPGDWDGGWRRTAAPQLTVSRAPLGVSDGLAFRAGLASWQNPSFDAGLGHALLPTAPTGLVNGVTRPAATPRTAHSAGGPLLLRALRPQGADEPGERERGQAADASTTGRTPERPSEGPGERNPGRRNPRGEIQSGPSVVRRPPSALGARRRRQPCGEG